MRVCVCVRGVWCQTNTQSLACRKTEQGREDTHWHTRITHQAIVSCCIKQKFDFRVAAEVANTG